MSNVREKMTSAVTEVKEGFQEVLTPKFIRSLMMLTVFLMSVTPVFASNGTLFGDLTVSLKDVYNELVPLINILALIFGLLAGGFWMFSPNTKHAETGKSWFFRVLVVWFCVSVFPWILISGRNLFGKTATGVSSDELIDIKPGS